MDETEYEVDMLDSGIFRKPKGHVFNAGDELRSIYRTGTTKPNEPWDEGASWNGLDRG